MCCTATGAWSQQIGKEQRAKRAAEAYEAADTNNDGKIDRFEARALGMSSKDFDKIDKNKDGVISPSEMGGFQRWLEEHELSVLNKSVPRARDAPNRDALRPNSQLGRTPSVLSKISTSTSLPSLHRRSLSELSSHSGRRSGTAAPLRSLSELSSHSGSVKLSPAGIEAWRQECQRKKALQNQNIAELGPHFIYGKNTTDATQFQNAFIELEGCMPHQCGKAKNDGFVLKDPKTRCPVPPWQP
jgi:hypothetical protein